MGCCSKSVPMSGTGGFFELDIVLTTEETFLSLPGSSFLFCDGDVCNFVSIEFPWCSEVNFSWPESGEDLLSLDDIRSVRILLN